MAAPGTLTHVIEAAATVRDAAAAHQAAVMETASQGVVTTPSEQTTPPAGQS